MIYQGCFENREDVEREIGWQIDGEIIFARYDAECYDGTAIVVWRKDEALYMVEGGHCSCYGLSEGMDRVEELTVEVAEHLFDNGYGYWKDSDFQRVVREHFV